jgi:hypothetical protein
MAVKYTQMIIKCTNIFNSTKKLKMYPNWDFCFENIPDGNFDDNPIKNISFAV